jgi:hypothetical protein
VLEVIKSETATKDDLVINKIIQKLEQSKSLRSDAYYDIITKMYTIEEADKMISAIHEGTQLKIVCRLKSKADLQR